MKNKQISFLVLILLIASFSAVAQKGIKPGPKAKPTPKTVQKVAVQQTASPVVSDGNKAKAEEYFKQGQAFWKEFEITKTIDAYTKALQLYPNYPDALRERGTVYYMIQRNESAIADFDAYLKIEPKNIRILINRGSALSAIAEKLLDTEISPKKANDTAQRSLADFNAAAALDPKESGILNGRGKLFLDFGFHKEAIADFEQAIKIYPQNHFAYAYLGYAKFVSGAGTGIEELNKSIAITQQFAEAFYLRGNIERRLGRYDEARKDYDKAISMNNNNAKYFNARGMLHFILQEGDEAVKDFSSAINAQNDFGMAFYNRGMTYKKYPYSVSDDPKLNPIAKIRLQRQKMQSDFSSAIKFKPNLADAYIERGLMNSTSLTTELDAKELAELKTALADFEMALKIDPNSAEAYNGRGSCHDQLGKKDLALADYSKAIELDPSLATAYMGRMAIYCEMGKKELSIIDEKKIKQLGFAAINVCNLGGK